MGGIVTQKQKAGMKLMKQNQLLSMSLRLMIFREVRASEEDTYVWWNLRVGELLKKASGDELNRLTRMGVFHETVR